MAGIDQLDDVDKLLECHDGRRDTGDYPRQGAVNLVGSGEFQSTSAPGTGEEAVGLRVGGISGLRRCRLGIVDRLQERRRKGRRGEREQVKANEEDFVEGTADEKHCLRGNGQL